MLCNIQISWEESAIISAGEKRDISVVSGFVLDRFPLDGQESSLGQAITCFTSTRANRQRHIFNANNSFR